MNIQGNINQLLSMSQTAFGIVKGVKGVQKTAEASEATSNEVKGLQRGVQSVKSDVSTIKDLKWRELEKQTGVEGFLPDFAREEIDNKLKGTPPNTYVGTMQGSNNVKLEPSIHKVNQDWARRARQQAEQWEDFERFKQEETD